jgi:hypothetical protein
MHCTNGPQTRFGDRSAETLTFKRGWSAHCHPEFYRQLGARPEELTAEALAAMARKFGLPE